MSLQEAQIAALKYLCECYKKNPDAVFDLTAVARKHLLDPHEFGKYLVYKGFVKNQQFKPSVFLCQITSKGITEVAHEYLKKAMELNEKEKKAR